ncbi:MAG: hypothetical protein AB7P31_13565 [Steroidobacteraceae bacterium]
MKSQRHSWAAALAAAFAAGCSSGGGYGGPDGPPPATNAAPSITGLADLAFDQDTGASLAFTVGDKETPARDLAVSATSSDPTILPAAGLAISGNDATRTLTLTPREDATGTVSIAVTARDGQGAVTTRTIGVVYRAVLVSMRDAAFGTYGMAEDGTQQAVAGRTFVQDVDDPQAFDALLAQ